MEFMEYLKLKELQGAIEALANMLKAGDATPDYVAKRVIELAEGGK